MTAASSSGSARFIVGDTRDVTATLPDGSVDLVMTSPPFLALRSYLPADHPDKHREIGSEPTPAAFIDTLLALTAEWSRVLGPYGTLAVELGDTYSGSGGAGGDCGDYNDGGLRDGQARFNGSARKRAEAGVIDGGRPPRNGRRVRAEDVAAGILAPTRRPGPDDRDRIEGWPLAKSKALIPELYRIGLAYGINPLTGAPSPAGRWRVRNVVTWCRPNPPVGALGDKFRPATSDLVIACRATDRWFDLDAVRTEAIDQRVRTTNGRKMAEGDAAEVMTANYTERVPSNPAGSPPLDYWVIPPGGYPGSHYAVYPPELCRIPIEAMCPRQVCVACGKPRRRIVEPTNAVGHAVGRTAWTRDAATAALMHSGAITVDANHASVPDVAERVTLGWTDCGCDAAGWRPGIVFDPFAGSGTTLAVAVGHGRNAIGIDIDERNADLARERVGMFLEVEHHTPAVTHG